MQNGQQDQLPSLGNGYQNIGKKAEEIIDQNTYESKVKEVGGEDIAVATQNFKQNTASFQNQEGITTVLDADLVKSNLEECFQNSNYRNIEINGVKVFENMNDMQITKMSGFFYDIDNAKEMITASLPLIDNPNCKWTVGNANDLGDGMKLLSEYVVKLILLF